MKIKRSIVIDGVNYDEYLIDISDISIGVRDLGLGFISDITVTLSYVDGVADSIGKNAQVGVMIDSNSYVYSGVIRKVQVAQGKVTLSISHISAVRQFKSLKTVFSQDAEKYMTIPVLYAGMVLKVKGCSLYKTSDPKYFFIISDRDNFSESVVSDAAYGVLIPVYKNEKDYFYNNSSIIL